MTTSAASRSRRHTATLADGRQIHYYNDAGDEHFHVTDERTLPPRDAPSELRWDVFRREWVTVAAHRQDRTFLPDAAHCPLCASSDGRATEIPAPTYDVAVFENRFPSFTGRSHAAPTPPSPASLSIGARGGGSSEVISFTPEHTLSFVDLPVRRVRTVIDAWADRTKELAARDDVASVFVFENSGVEVGVTLSHPHGQIYAYPFVPPVQARQQEAVREYRAECGRDLVEEVLSSERRDGTRVVLDVGDWVAFVPFAARWPIEVHLYPTVDVRSFADLDANLRDTLAKAYLNVLRRLRGLYDDPTPYIAAWHQQADEGEGRLHLELFSIRRAAGKLKYLAGSESAMGAFITDVAPEIVAKRLRDAA